MNKRGWLWLLAWMAMAAFAVSASATLTMDRWTIDGGGGRATGGSLQLGGTIGQPDAGFLSGGSLVLHGGFWLGGASASAIPEPEQEREQEPELEIAVPLAFAVTACAPSPFTHATRLRLDLPEPRMVRAGVHDLTGRLVRSLCVQTLPAGSHDLRWDGCDDGGRRLPSGIFLVRIEAGSDRTTRRVVWLAR
ncbi:MAG: hypothetical protein KBD56_06940 [Candidatus Eisenbacteria bacterium]|nr:hypothetical protein [Candidatus Eisenbacteria bacterium]